MSQNYPRSWHITIPQMNRVYSPADGMRVRFNIQQATVHSPNIATIKITNANRSVCEAFAKAEPSEGGPPVTISAGYVGNEGILFKGHVVRPIYGRENPTDTLLQILCTDGNQATSHAYVNKTFPPGSTPQDHFNEALNQMKQFGIGLGFVGPNVMLSQPVYPRAVTLFGMAHAVMSTIAKSKGATWSIQNLLVHMLKPSDSMPGGAFELNSETGLIGMPTLTPDGVFVRTLINPQMTIDAMVHIDQGLIQGYLPALAPNGSIAPSNLPGAPIAHIAADGIYRIVKIDVDGDTRGTPWYMDMMVLQPGETTNVSKDYGT